MDKGQALTEIRSDIDRKYSAKGLEPTPTPLPSVAR